MTTGREMAGRIRKGARATLRRAMPFVSEHMASVNDFHSQREQFEARRAKRGEAHIVHWFHDVTDPVSHLGAQVLTRLSRTYEIDLRIHLVSPPTDEMVPERQLYNEWIIKDAADIAPAYLLDFNPETFVPTRPEFDLAGRLLSAALARSTFSEDAPRIGTALWSGGKEVLHEIAREMPVADPTLTAKHLLEGDRELERQGHYLGGIFAYGNECYQGIDRMHHLEARLVDLGVRNAWSAPKLIVPRRPEGRQPLPGKADHIGLEFYVSMQDPFSYIAMERAFRLARCYGVAIEMRPVVPVLPGGQTLPPLKRHYAAFDLQREAEAVQVRFGPGIPSTARSAERVSALFPWARDQGRGNDLLLSFAQGIFADGFDAETDDGLGTIVERAGLDWNKARAHLNDDEWRLEFESNRVDLIQSGSSDTPTFRLIGGHATEDFVTRGQDRLWLVEEEIRKRMGAGHGFGQGQDFGASQIAG